MKLIPFETAKKLADKGFDKPTLLRYNDNGEIPKLLPDVFEQSKNNFYRAPNIYEVMEWLREVKGIDVLPQRGHINIDNNGKVTRYYKVNIYFEHRFACTLDNDEQDYSTYEQSSIEGINFVLDNLI